MKTDQLFNNNNPSSKKGFQWLHVLLLLLVPFIIYFYFLKWKITSIHDDDLYIYQAYLKDPSRFNVSLTFGQYRPVRDFFLHTIIKLFDKDFTAFYCFNVAIQSINTILFACILNLLLRSISLSVFLSLIFGLSRFCFYNVTQLFNGGVLEGLASMFFLLFLFFTVSIVTRPGITVFAQKRGIFLSILFANVSLYTHERYIIIFPFILLMILFFPKFKGISIKWKISVSLLTIASIILNILIKNQVYSVEFLKGSGNTNIEFSFSSGFKFLEEAMYGLLQFSKGPEYVVGLQFSSLPFIYKACVIIIIILFIWVLGLYLWKVILSLRSKKNDYPPHIALFFFLFALTLLCMVPAIFQQRLELRWFQASLCVLIPMFVIGINYLTEKSAGLKYLLYFLLGVSFLCTNYYYVYKGSQNLYYSTSASVGNAFDKAITDSTIHLGKSNLYILEKERNAQRENEINWALVSGYFFTPYKSNIKNMTFIDPYTSFPNFNSSNDEIIYLNIENNFQTFKYSITNITNEYVKDSLRKFNAQTFAITQPVNKNFHAERLTITNESIKDITTDGFYDIENGTRWTNGNASISFSKDYFIKDTVTIKLTTYMPPLCSNVNPKIFLTGQHEKEYEPSLLKREGDIFIFKFYTSELTAIKKINIRSEKINSGQDKRVLSFPFISLEIN